MAQKKPNRRRNGKVDQSSSQRSRPGQGPTFAIRTAGPVHRIQMYVLDPPEPIRRPREKRKNRLPSRLSRRPRWHISRGYFRLSGRCHVDAHLIPHVGRGYREPVGAVVDREALG